jgi:hypothetical protein
MKICGLLALASIAEAYVSPISVKLSSRAFAGTHPARTDVRFMSQKSDESKQAYEAIVDEEIDDIETRMQKKRANKLAKNTEIRKKLIAESIAPWRTLRLFLYGSLGSGATLGGLITAAGVAAAVSGARADLNLNTEVSCRRILCMHH